MKQMARGNAGFQVGIKVLILGQGPELIYTVDASLMQRCSTYQPSCIDTRPVSPWAWQYFLETTRQDRQVPPLKLSIANI